MIKYLYLTERNWVLPWVNGGEVPIFPASTYLSSLREGIKTPDENLVHQSPVNISSLSPLGMYIEGVEDLSMTSCHVGGVSIPNFTGANFYTEDGLILSFCNKKSSSICSRLGKQACIKIFDIDDLKNIIDTQLGVQGVAGDCNYTTDHQRKDSRQNKVADF